MRTSALCAANARVSPGARRRVTDNAWHQCASPHARWASNATKALSRSAIPPQRGSARRIMPRPCARFCARGLARALLEAAPHGGPRAPTQTSSSNIYGGSSPHAIQQAPWPRRCGRGGCPLGRAGRGHQGATLLMTTLQPHARAARAQDLECGLARRPTAAQS